MDAVATARVSLGRQTWNFARHFLEMCISMCAGGAILALVVLGIPALMGAPDLREQFPEVGLILIAILLTLPMAAWMRLRGMEWRPIVRDVGRPDWPGDPADWPGMVRRGIRKHAANFVRELLRHLVRGHVRRHALPP